MSASEKPRLTAGVGKARLAPIFSAGGAPAAYFAGGFAAGFAGRRPA